MVLAGLASLMLSAAAPSFDCAQASGVERTVCHEPRLAALDARLAQAYASALRAAPADAAATRQTQRTWLRERDESCAKEAAPAPCLDGYYRNRLEALGGARRLRDETAGQAPASDAYAGFVGHWRVVGVSAGEDAGSVTNFGTDEPRYMGLELSVEPRTVRWLNGSTENHATDVCGGPSFAPRAVKTALPSGWKAVTLKCREGERWVEWPVDLTLRSHDVADLAWDDEALLHLKRVAPGAKTPPPPHSIPLPPLPPDGAQQVASDRAFLASLQSAVRRRDRQWLAAQGAISVNRQDGASHGYTPDEVREAYDWIMTPEIERAVLAQDPGKLFRNWRGAMVGNGQVWFEQVLRGDRWVYKVIAINQTAPVVGR